MKVPVSLTDIEALTANPGVVGYVPVGDVGALCEALRIAVAAPAGLCCPKCGWMWGESRDEYNGCEQCDENAAALAAVRELVDLGERP